jgi:hypothetical protein
MRLRTPWMLSETFPVANIGTTHSVITAAHQKREGNEMLRSGLVAAAVRAPKFFG